MCQRVYDHRSDQKAKEESGGEHPDRDQDLQPDRLDALDDQQIEDGDDAADQSAERPADNGYDGYESRAVSPDQDQGKRQNGKDDLVPFHGGCQADFLLALFQDGASQIIPGDVPDLPVFGLETLFRNFYELLTVHI